MSNRDFAERLGYLASRGMRETRHKKEIAIAYSQGFEKGIIAASQSDECLYDPDLNCSDFVCDGC